MTATLAEQVQRLSTEEKIELLDFVQKELAHEAGEIDIPQWQADELDRREREVAEGRAKWMTIDECRQAWEARQR